MYHCISHHISMPLHRNGDSRSDDTDRELKVKAIDPKLSPVK